MVHLFADGTKLKIPSEIIRGTAGFFFLIEFYDPQQLDHVAAISSNNREQCSRKLEGYVLRVFQFLFYECQITRSGSG